MAEVVASFEVLAGTATTLTLDVAGLTPRALAAMIEENAVVDLSLCHECAHRISDPDSGELTGFTVDGVNYERTPFGLWKVSR